MSIFSTFSQRAANRVFFSIVLGGLSGICYSALIPLVLLSIRPTDPSFEPVNDGVVTFLSFEVAHYQLAFVYIALCLLILVMRTTSEVILTRVSTEVARGIRTEFYGRISAAPISAIERIGSSKIVASLNIDVPRILAGGRAVPALLINGITVVGMLAFLVYLNPDVFKLVMMAIIFGVVCYQIPMTIGRSILHKTREGFDQLQEALKGLIFGAKELKLDHKKRELYFKKMLIENESRIAGQDKTAQTIMRASSSFGDLLSFFVIGAVSFIFVNYYAISQEELIGVVMTLLYVAGPISVLLSAIPEMAVASVSYRKLNTLLAAIPRENINPALSELPSWSTFRFDNVQYNYPSLSDEAGFQVGPLNLQVNRGEITFIVGANGSGKSTLSKLLTLHYTPSSGEMTFDDSIVGNDNIVSYRQQICAIYTDYYLFDRLLIEMTEEVEKSAIRYMEKLHLTGKVTLDRDMFSTLSLSDGQRKRLALLVAFLEDKEIYLFDEWAADQDPEFKNVFYKDILPELKRKNKVVIVISHDDRYFDIADTIITMEQGKIINTRRTAPKLMQGEALAIQ